MTWRSAHLPKHQTQGRSRGTRHVNALTTKPLCDHQSRGHHITPHPSSALSTHANAAVEWPDIQLSKESLISFSSLRRVSRRISVLVRIQKARYWFEYKRLWEWRGEIGRTRRWERGARRRGGHQEMEAREWGKIEARSTHPVQIERLYMICRNPTPLGVSVDTSGLHTSDHDELESGGSTGHVECGGPIQAMWNVGGSSPTGNVECEGIGGRIRRGSGDGVHRSAICGTPGTPRL
jgi:hypothetical protein